jgi:hypothetical protein
LSDLLGNRRGSLARCKGDDEKKRDRERQNARCPGMCWHQHVPLDNRGFVMNVQQRSFAAYGFDVPGFISSIGPQLIDNSSKNN